MDKLPIKKQHLLIAGSLILLLACYQLAFKPTISAWQMHRQFEKQLAAAGDLSVQPAYLERQDHNLGEVIKSYQMDSVTFREHVVSTIATLAEQCQVKMTGVPTDDAAYHAGDLIVQKVNLEGAFFNLLRLVDTVQRSKQIGVLRSASWKMSRSFGINDKKRLGLELYMEMYRKTGH